MSHSKQQALEREAFVQSLAIGIRDGFLSDEAQRWSGMSPAGAGRRALVLADEIVAEFVAECERRNAALDAQFDERPIDTPSKLGLAAGL